MRRGFLRARVTVLRQRHAVEVLLQVRGGDDAGPLLRRKLASVPSLGRRRRETVEVVPVQLAKLLLQLRSSPRRAGRQNQTLGVLPQPAVLVNDVRLAAGRNLVRGSFLYVPHTPPTKVGERPRADRIFLQTSRVAESAGACVRVARLETLLPGLKIVARVAVRGVRGTGEPSTAPDDVTVESRAADPGIVSWSVKNTPSHTVLCWRSMPPLFRNASHAA